MVFWGFDGKGLVLNKTQVVHLQKINDFPLQNVSTFHEQALHIEWTNMQFGTNGRVHRMDSLRHHPISWVSVGVNGMVEIACGCLSSNVWYFLLGITHVKTLWMSFTVVDGNIMGAHWLPLNITALMNRIVLFSQLNYLLIDFYWNLLELLGKLLSFLVQGFSVIINGVIVVWSIWIAKRIGSCKTGSFRVKWLLNSSPVRQCRLLPRIWFMNTRI